MVKGKIYEFVTQFVTQFVIQWNNKNIDISLEKRLTMEHYLTKKHFRR